MTSTVASRDRFLTALGRAVRTRRGGAGYSLRELSSHAGVSERFLAELEAGRGNISVARLADVARALGTSGAGLLGDAERDEAAHHTPTVVALLGLRGAGKTTIGQRAAKRLGVPFVELDAIVEKAAGMSLAAMFELHGAQYYRRVERAALAQFLARGEPAVLATGGSLVTDAETFAALRRAALTVWLKAKPEDHWARVVAQGDARPMADRSDAMADLRRLLAARAPLYEQADRVVDTSALGVERASRAVVRALREATAG